MSAAAVRSQSDRNGDPDQILGYVRRRWNDNSWASTSVNYAGTYDIASASRKRGCDSSLGLRCRFAYVLTHSNAYRKRGRYAHYAYIYRPRRPLSDR